MGSTADQATAHVLEAARRVTGMQAAYLAEFEAGDQVLRCVDGDVAAFDFHVGHRSRLESTFCQRVVDGRLERAVPDASINPVTRDFPGTRNAGIRGYLGLPVRLPDGRLYGTLCCIDQEACPDLSEHDADVLEAMAEMLGHHLRSGQEVERVVRERDELLASVSHDLGRRSWPCASSARTSSTTRSTRQAPG